MAGRADRETPIDIKSFLAGETDITKNEDGLVVVEKRAKSEKPTETEKPQKVEKVIKEEISEIEKVEKGGIDNSNEREKLKDEEADVLARLEVGGKGNNKNKLTKKLKDLREKIAFLEAEKKKNEEKDDYWAKRSKFQNDSVEESRNAVIEKKKARESAQKNTFEAKPQDETGEVILALEKDKADWKKHLAMLTEKFNESIERDPEKNNPRETGIRTKIASKMQDSRDKVFKIDAEIKKFNLEDDTGENTGNPKDYSNWWKERQGDRKKLFEQKEAEKNMQTINPNSLILKNMPEKNREISSEDYEKELEKNSIDVYSKVNKESELKEEQKKTADTYASEFKNREEISGKKKDRREKLQKEGDAEKEKRAAELKEKEEFTESYKRQFGEKEESGEDVKKTEIVDTTIADSEKVDSEGQLKAKIDRLKNLPEEAKEIMREKMMDDEVKRISDEEKDALQEKKISELEIENTKLKASLENAKEVESKLAAMKAGIKEEKDKLIAEGETGRTVVEKVKNFVKKHPKATTVIALGLVGGGFAAFGSAPLYFGAQALVKAWGGSLWLPYAHGASSLTPAVATGAFFGGEKLAKWIGEKIGAVETEKDAKTAVKEVLERIKNPADESQTRSDKNGASNAVSPEDAVKYFEENKDKSNDELNLKDIKKMAEAIMPGTTLNPLAFLINKKGVKNNEAFNWLNEKKKEIEKYQKEKNEESEKTSVEQESDGVLLKNPKKSLAEETGGKLIKKTERMKKIAPETKTSEEARRENNKQPEKANEIDVIEGSGSAKELTLEEKREMRKIAEDNKIDIISPSAKVKEEKNKTEDKFDKKAEEIKTFIKLLKMGKKPGKEIFEYLEILRHHFLYADNPNRTNFNSKIRPEIDKLSKKEKTDMIDLVVEYAMPRKKEFLGTPFLYDLEDIVCGKDFTKEDYIEKGKKENVEWLYGNKK